ncbi:TPA: hypothetical protein RQJ59_004557 [Vibrio vulnificus]|nr:hypothetical protein [Vibrio vulnificus]
MNILETITAWPVIVQGALGSALFALISYIGQAVVKFTYAKWAIYSKYSNEVLASQKAGLIDSYLNKNTQKTASILSIMMFSSLHYLMKAILFVAFGLIADSALPVFGVVGYTIGFIYLFKAMSYSPHLGFFDKYSEEELVAQRDRLLKEANN